MRSALAEAIDEVDPTSVEEIILQSYLFAGFPRALNAARAWRAVSGRPAPAKDGEATVEDLALWRARGEETCSIVYGDHYERLRRNIVRVRAGRMRNMLAPASARWQNSCRRISARTCLTIDFMEGCRPGNLPERYRCSHGLIRQDGDLFSLSRRGKHCYMPIASRSSSTAEQSLRKR